MFWGCFSYDLKGPCHCWAPETKKEKEEAEKFLQEMNQILEPLKRAEWELKTATRLWDYKAKEDQSLNRSGIKIQAS